MWMFCANNYLAPVYSDCFDQEAALRTAIDEGNTEEWTKIVTELGACTLVKQSEFYFEVGETNYEHIRGIFLKDHFHYKYRNSNSNTTGCTKKRLFRRS